MKVKYGHKELMGIGQQLVKIILERTESGIDAQGNEFKEYSERPFAMPSGAIPKGTRALMLEQGKLSYFKRNKKTWVVIKDGYISLKKTIYRKTNWDGRPNLIMTGKMLRAMKVVNVGNNKIVIGFMRSEEAEKAGWNAERGREILGINDNDMNDTALMQLLENVQIT
jgi:hypothetical protein